MKVLFAINEAYPLYKIGGLGDVGGSLPKALTALTCDLRLILPYHPEIRLPESQNPILCQFTVVYNHKPLEITVYLSHLPGSGVPVYLVRESLYLSNHTDASDNDADKYAVFSLCISEFVANHFPNWQPDIIHCHDWHTALVPVLLKHKYPQVKSATIITIHNLQYQGITATPVSQKLQLDQSACQFLSQDMLDFELNILLEGLVHTHLITTVSETYAKEIVRGSESDPVAAVLASRHEQLIGITNGLDTSAFNPLTDPHLDFHYSKANLQAGKTENKLRLLKRFNLNPATGRVLAFVGRVDPNQKGGELLIEALNRRLLPTPNSAFIFLGTGDSNLEKQLHQAAADRPEVAVVTRFDEPLARLLYAGSDFLLIPSHYEPCGLIQLVAMRYGTLPIAHATGGLIDTIIPGKTGWLYTPNTVECMMASLSQALDTAHHPAQINDMRLTAMQQDFSWRNPAQKYFNAYKQLLDNH